MESKFLTDKENDFYDEWKDFCDTIVKYAVFEEPIDYIAENKEVHIKYDKGYKYLLSIKKNFIDFIKTFTEVAWDEEITEDNIILMDKEFITIDFDKKESDLIYEVRIKNKCAYFVLIEIQSSVDRKMAYRLLNYMIEIWRKWEASSRLKGKRFVLPKIVPCVLYNGREKWSAPIEFKYLYDDINDEDYLVNFKYILIDIHRYKPEHLLNLGNVISSAFYLDTATRENMEERLINLTKLLASANKEEIEEFRRWTINMFVLDGEKQKIIEEKFSKEETEMGNLAQIGKEIHDEGVKEGIEKGIKKGIEQGRIISIKKILSRKFKEKNDWINILIETSPAEKLDEIEDKIFEITSWDEVKDILTRA